MKILTRYNWLGIKFFVRFHCNVTFLRFHCSKQHIFAYQCLFIYVSILSALEMQHAVLSAAGILECTGNVDALIICKFRNIGDLADGTTPAAVVACILLCKPAGRTRVVPVLVRARVLRPPPRPAR